MSSPAPKVTCQNLSSGWSVSHKTCKGLGFEMQVMFFVHECVCIPSLLEAFFYNLFKHGVEVIIVKHKTVKLVS